MVSVLCLGLCVGTFVLSPNIFRRLPNDVQRRLAGHFPALEGWIATRDPALETLPTVDPARLAASVALDTSVTPASARPVIILTPLADAITPGVSPTPVPRPAAATSTPLPARYRLERAVRERQGWNNCGPANIVQALHIVGVDKTQEEIAAWLKPNSNDGNVSPWQMAQYVREFTPLRALYRHNGNFELLRRLVYAGFGVIIETGLYDHEDGSWMGHYQTVVGWDNLGEGGGYFLALDTYMSNGPDGLGRRETFDDLDSRWKHFNRLYLVVYPPEQEAQLQAILGTDWDERANLGGALERALMETQFRPTDVFAWFNLGTTYTLLGQWTPAAAAYDRARGTGEGLPWRMLWYQFGPYQAYYQVGELRTAVDLATAVISQTNHIEESYYYRGAAYLALGVTEQGENDLQTALRLNRNFAPAQAALDSWRAGTLPEPVAL